MRKEARRLLGLFLVILGIILVVNPAGITGRVILEDTGGKVGSFFGVAFIIVGWVLFVISTRDKESKLVVTAKEEEPDTLAEAAKEGKIRQYIQGKKIIHDTNLPSSGKPYSKHTRFVGKKISEKNYLAKSGREAQYRPDHSLGEIRKFERKIVEKGRGKPWTGNPNMAVVYGLSSSKYGPSGAYEHKAVRGVKVEMEERADGIHIHGFPIREKDIPAAIKKEIRRKRQKSPKAA